MADTKESKPGARNVGGPLARVVQNAEPPEEIFVDGVMAISLRHGVAKIECYRVAGRASPSDPTELRRPSHRLVLPAVALGELLQILERTRSAIVAAAERARDTKTDEIL